MTSREFHTLAQAGAWEETELGGAVVTYEPWLLAWIWEARHQNRAIGHTSQQRLQEVFRSKAWRKNGESLIYCRAYRLGDGQNRIYGALITESTFASVTIWGVDMEESLPTIDIGKKRSGADILTLHGVSDAGAIAAALRTHYRLCTGTITSATTEQLADNGICAYYEQHKAIHYSLTPGYKIKRYAPPSLGIALHYLFKQRDAVLADQMYAHLATGEHLGARDPVLVLREWLGLQREKADATRQQLDVATYADRAAQIIRTWNALRQGRSITRPGILGKPEDPFPEIQ